MKLKGKSKRMLGVTVVLVAGVAVWGGMQVFAAGSPASGATALGKVTPAVALVPAGATLYKTWVNTGSNFTAMPGGTFPGNLVSIDSPTNIHCPAPSHHTCLLVVNTQVQVGNSGTANNRVFEIPTLDGNYIGNAPYLGIAPAAGFYAGFSWQDAISTLPGGIHTVQTFVGSDFAATQPYFTVQYSVYTF